MHTIYKLENTIREYSWGSKTAFSALFNKADPAPNPQAELWMGAHPLAPSFVLAGNKKISLADLIRANPIEILGTSAASEFGNTLPFLFKILASEKPLSIQVHPDLAQAEAGYRNEEEKQVPIESPLRTYKDKNHKPELICALTPFWALNGFRSYDEIISSFGLFSNGDIKKQVVRFEGDQSENGLKKFYSFIMTIAEPAKSEVIEEAISVAGSAGQSDPHLKWILSVKDQYPDDIGLLSFLFLNLIELKPGEALYLPSRRLHSYLSGIGIEIMANSDNVIRGGLTEKHVDIKELLSVLSFVPSSPSVLRAAHTAPHEKTYETDAREFILSRITISHQVYKPHNAKRNVEIIVVADGSGQIIDTNQHNSIPLQRGDSAIVPACVADYRIEGKLSVFKAAVPS